MLRSLRKQKKKRALRIFFATDVHGSDVCFRKFLAAAKVYEADVLLLGGDFAGKGLVPVLRDGDDLRTEIDGKQVSVPADGWDQLTADINRRGFYAAQMEPDELAELQQDGAALDRKFRSEIAAQAERWCRLAAERLDPAVRCIITPGNDDPLAIDPVLRSAPRIECPERELCEIGPILLASCGDVTPTPWNTEREFSEDELGRRLSAILDQAPAGAKIVANFHNPPYGSGLDFAAALDETLLPVIRGGRPSIIPVGSKAVREVIKKYQPVVGLHGHIHESKAAQRIGKTMCFNPGSEYSSDVLRGVIVDFDAVGDHLDFLFTSG